MGIRNYNNTSVPQTIQNSGGIDNSPSTTGITVGSNTSFPAVPFTLGLERGTTNQEVVECTALSGSTGFIVTRGFNGSPILAHPQGASVELTSAAIDYSEANAFVNLLQDKGDLLVFGSIAQRFAVGADGTALTADSGQSSGLSWVQPVPAGICAYTAASAPPTGWLLRNGASVLRASYPNLFSAIGTTYGSVDGSHFTLPIGINQVDIGAGDAYALGDVGRHVQITPTVGQLPAHSHTNTVYIGSIPVGSTDTAVVVISPPSAFGIPTSGSGGLRSSFTTQPSVVVDIDNTGSGTPINILNPYQALTPIIKY